MKKLLILKIDNYVYELIDEKHQLYSLNLEFFNLKEQPLVNDYLIFDEELLKEKTFYTFGPLNGKYGKILNQENDKDIMVIISKNNKIYLQRYYG